MPLDKPALWKAAAELFETLIGVVGYAAPEVLLAAGEILTSYAEEKCSDIGMGFSQMNEIAARGAVKGMQYANKEGRLH